MGSSELGIGSRLRLARERRGYSQRRLAATAGTTQARVSRLEAGLERNPSADLLVRLAGATGVGAGWLLDGSGSGPREPNIHNRRENNTNKIGRQKPPKST